MKKIYVSILWIFSITALQAQVIGPDQLIHFPIFDNYAGKDILTDTQGNVYITGIYQGEVNLNPQGNPETFTSVGQNDMFLAKYDPLGNLLWAHSFGDTDYDWSASVALDSQGNIAIAGYYQGTVDFDPDPNNTVNLVSAGRTIFAAKFSSDGSLIWAKNTTGNNLRNIPREVQIDDSDNILVLTNFAGTVDFDPGAATENRTSTNSIRSHLALWKLSPTGDFIFAKSFGGPESTQSEDFAIGTSGSIYIAGTFQRTVDFDPGEGLADLTEVDNRDIFVLKLSEAGDFDWVRHFGGEGVDYGLAIETDADENIIVAGRFSDSVDFDPGPDTYVLDPMSQQGYLLKLDTDGNFVWAFAPEGGVNTWSTSHSIATDANGNVYAFGKFSGELDFEPGSGEFVMNTDNGIFILKTASNGLLSWAQKMVSNTGSLWTNEIYATDEDELLLLGEFREELSYPMPQDTFTLAQTGSGDQWDLFIAWMSPQIVSGTYNLDGKSFNIYPNPAMTILNIDAGELNSVTSIRLLDAKGQEVASFPGVSNAQQLDISNIPAGLYYLSITSEENIYTEKLVIE